MAICGDSCTIRIDDSTAFEGHRFTITANAPEIDIRHFGSGDYGDFIACFKDGTIDVETYLPITTLEAGDTANIVATVGEKTLTAADTLLTNVTVGVDAKDVVNYTYSFKLTGDITGW